jgi:predicted permease
MPLIPYTLGDKILGWAVFFIVGPAPLPWLFGVLVLKSVLGERVVEWGFFYVVGPMLEACAAIAQAVLYERGKGPFQ